MMGEIADEHLDRYLDWGDEQYEADYYPPCRAPRLKARAKDFPIVEPVL
jgi:hypothetical protein